MALVSKSIPNLINGISQQPPSLRLGTQGEAQENGLSDIVDGLKKRPHTNFIKKLVRCKSNWAASTSSALTQGNLTASNTQDLTTSELNAAFISTYKRSSDEQYTIVILPDATTPIILVYDILGNLRYESAKSSWLADGSNISYVENTVTYYANSDSTAYLIGLNAAGAAAALGSTDITSTSVADATFIVNKTKTVTLTDQKIPPKDSPSALIYLKSVNYERQYTLKITPKESATATGISVTTTSGDNDSGNNEDQKLRVSTIIGEQGTSGSTSLRGQIQDSSATYSGGFTQDAYAVGAAANSDIELNNHVQTASRITIDTANFDSSNANMVVVVGGNYIAYDANNVTGWKYTGDTREIQLPASAVEAIPATNPFGTWNNNPYYIFTRGSVSVYKTASGVTEDLLITPVTYAGKESYFVITAPESGSFGDFDITASDDDGGVNLNAFKGTCKSFTSLPNQCIDQYRLQVAGDNNKKEDNFYVKFEGGSGSGVWKETVGDGLFNDFDLLTMPHQLQQDPYQVGSLHFCFKAADWSSRACGDDDTNPMPSFVNSTINDVFFHRNRLGVLSGENVIFSEASGYFNFYRTTVRALLDSDPIDVAVSQNEVSILKAAVPIQDNLLLFSELNQFTLSAAQLLTPAEVTVDQSTKFECDLTATPVGAGNSVFFGTKGGSFAGVREYYTDNSTEIKDATLVTQHVPHYLEGNIRRMVASTNEDMLICLTSSVKSEAYIYKYYDSANERLQSSWSKWIFDTDILDMSFNNSDLYITFSDGRFEKMDLSQQAPDISFAVDNSINTDIIAGAGSFTISGVNYTAKGFIGDPSGFGGDTTTIGSNNNGVISDLLVYKNLSTNTFHLHCVLITIPAGIESLDDVPVSVTIGSTTINFTSRQFFPYHRSSATTPILVGATITESEYNAVFNNTTGNEIVTLNRTTTTFTRKDYPVHLDHQVKVQASASAAASFTTSDLNTAYTATTATQFIDHKGDLVATGNSDATKAKVVAYIHNKSHTENGATVGNYVYAGEPFTFKYQLSEQVFKPETNDPTQIARFQLRNINFKYNDTGTFDVTTVSTGRTPKVTNFTGRITGQANNLLGYAAVVDDGSFKVGVQSQAKETAITITNSSHLPSTFQSAEWEGFIHSRNTRI